MFGHLARQKPALKRDAPKAAHSYNMRHCYSGLPQHRIPLCHFRRSVRFFGAICGMGPITSLILLRLGCANARNRTDQKLATLATVPLAVKVNIAFNSFHTASFDPDAVACDRIMKIQTTPLFPERKLTRLRVNLWLKHPQNPISQPCQN